MIFSVRGVSEEVQKALKIRSAETGETMRDITERALRRELGMLVHWTELNLLDTDGETELNMSDADKRTYLEEYRRTGSISGVFFARIGADHEDPDDASTWGPESPDHVDWTGFNAR